MRMRTAMAFLLSVAVVLTAGALAGVAAPALAQMAAVNPPDWDQLTDQTLAAVKAHYGSLTDDQIRQIRPLLRAHLPRMRALFDSYAAGKSVDAAPALLKQYQETRATFKASVDPILTEPQRKDFMAIRAEFDAEMKKAFIEARVQWFERAVGVDAGQADKLRPILMEHLEKRLQIFSSTDETKDPAAAQKDFRIQLQKLQGETDARLKTVLTPEQMGKYQDARTAAAEEVPKPPTH
jgi:Spy/CpxP family protein refolding chaperone